MNGARATLLLATVLTGLSAGFFFTYEASVTVGLAEVSDVAYVEMFQAINNTVQNPAFGIVFFGSIPATALAIAANMKSAGQLAGVLMAVALALYVAGLIVTGTGNVPLNNDLAGYENVTPESAARARADFESGWNQLNLARTLAIGASFTALATACVLTTPHRGERGLSALTGQTE